MIDPAASPPHYAGFWRRFAALWLDFLVLTPWLLLDYWLNQTSRQAAMYDVVPSVLLGLLFNLYMVHRYGGTPGKLLMKIRITMVDGTPVSWSAVFWRHSVQLVLQLASAAALLPVIAAMSDAEYLSLDFMERSVKLIALAPPWYGALTKTQQVWALGELVSMLFNKRRRSLHDLMAGTVVIAHARAAEPTSS